MNRRNIIYIMVAAVLALLPASVLHAQVAGSPVNDKNAIDYRYQKFNGKLPRFADSIKFQDRIYTTFSGGIGTNWEYSQQQNDYKLDLSGKWTVGYRLSPVHAVETDFIWSKKDERTNWGLNLNYAMNINNFATRRDNHNKLEAIFLSGLSYRRTTENHFGVNAGMRLQYNTGIVTGIFIEPRLNILSAHKDAMNAFITEPQVMLGFTLRFHQPRYYAWDYLTPIAIKTNLLYDAATAANIGIEIPMRDKWSLGFDLLCPWWHDYYKHRYFQLLHGSMDVKYWFGNREDKLQLTGWFAGLTAGGGKYDLMFEDVNGIQGEVTEAGIIAGYAHTINKAKTLRMEYAVGIGYLQSNYRKYYWDGYDYSLVAPSPQSWDYKVFGPIRAQVSLVYWLKLRSKISGRD